jgi:tetratricopeptide (TPR) repeat protein
VGRTTWGRGRRLATGLLLALAIAAVYAPVRQHAFVEWDDPLYVRDNPVVARGLDLASTRWALTAGAAFLWHPLTWLSLLLDAELHGTGRAGPFALTNVALHVANSLLLLALLSAATGRFGPSALAAALFALHPLRVESVAWVSARKDGLSGLFALLALWGYLRWARAGGRARYLAALGAFAGALLAKPTHLTLPLLLFLLDAWPLDRLRPALAGGRTALARLVAEKLPWLGVAAVAFAANLWMMERVANPWNADLPLHQRLLAVPLDLLFYLGKSLWPAGLAVAYPGPHQQGLPFYSSAELAAGWCGLAGVATLALWLRARAPAVTWGLAWFALALLPMLQIVPTGLRLAHDRYTWLPAIGLSVAAAFGAAQLWSRLPRLRPLWSGLAAATLVACALASAAQVRHWRDSESLLGHTLAVTERNAIARFARGVARARSGDGDGAIADLRAALAIHPGHADSLNSLGYLLSRRGEHAAAIVQLRRALAERPGYALAMSNLGNALEANGEPEEALAWLRRASERSPPSADAHYWLALALERRGDPEAIRHYRRALEIDPGHPWSREALARLGVAR